jgi:hypothetical protein
METSNIHDVGAWGQDKKGWRTSEESEFAGTTPYQARRLFQEVGTDQMNQYGNGNVSLASHPQRANDNGKRPNESRDGALGEVTESSSSSPTGTAFVQALKRLRVSYHDSVPSLFPLEGRSAAQKQWREGVSRNDGPSFSQLSPPEPHQHEHQPFSQSSSSLPCVVPANQILGALHEERRIRLLQQQRFQHLPRGVEGVSSQSVATPAWQAASEHGADPSFYSSLHFVSTSSPHSATPSATTPRRSWKPKRISLHTDSKLR